MHQSGEICTQPTATGGCDRNPGEYPDCPGVSTEMVLSTHHWRGIFWGRSHALMDARLNNKISRLTLYWCPSSQVKTNDRDKKRALFLYSISDRVWFQIKITAQSPRRSDKTWYRTTLSDWSVLYKKKTIHILLVTIYIL